MGTGELTSLEDLQKFLAEELAQHGGEADPSTLGRAFRPITDGLGLESPPKKAELQTPSPASAIPKQMGPVAPAIKETKVSVASVLAEKAEAPEPPRLEPTVAPEIKPEFDLAPIEEAPRVVPPRLPAPSSARRFLALMVDEISVLTLFSVALVMTSNAMSQGETGLSIKVLQHLRNPAMLRFAAFEFAGVWMLYFLITIGIMDRTFGMWVWNIRISFGQDQDDSQSLRKIMRIFWSFVMYAPAVTLPLLVPRINGRNLLDVLSGTHLYQPEAE